MRPKPTLIACAVGSVLAVALPAVASAAPHPCRGPATISSPRGVTDHNFTRPPDTGGSFATPLRTSTLRVGHAFQLGNSKATVLFDGVRFSVKAGSVFSLGCYGQVVGGPLLPSLHLQSGSVRVSDSARNPGGVDTTEALANPVLDYGHRLTFTVNRALSNPSELTEKGMFFDAHGFLEAPLGRTTVVTDGAGYTNITPYVGVNPGTCRHADGAELITTGHSKHYFTGRASYHGLK
jgi:hypothetical protein